jgi:SagB-type dehydrogenase family enzyme
VFANGRPQWCQGQEMGVRHSPDNSDAVRQVLSYHDLSKHHRHAYAAGPASLDWANQPDPFRTYAGAPTVDLPLLADAIVAAYAALDRPGAVASRRPALDTLAILLELSLGLSAWKEYRGTRWALRCNPSSGNLHPTEGYVVVPPLRGLEAGVYHYISRDHRLERRAAFTPAAAAVLAERLPGPSFLVGLSSVHWREAWKYGVRAYRYCQHDAGHALAAVRCAAAALGWSARLLEAPADADIAALLGLDRDADFAGIDPSDREHPDLLAVVGRPPLAFDGLDLPRATSWAGAANALSQRHVHWEPIDCVARAALKRRTGPTAAFDAPPLPALAERPPHRPRPVPAAALIRGRRSALDFDERTGLEAAALYHLLDHLLPRPGVSPVDVLPGRPRLHLALFVHRVGGLAPGLYAVVRDGAAHDALRAACRPTFVWRRPAGCPDHLPLFLLAEGDFRATARALSCHQDIAADGAFSLAMVAEFGEVIRGGGPWWYRRLFWEAGVLGQALYLEAEAAGVRGTGIGCYFDDSTHDVLGLEGDRFQVLYHFAVGGPVEDPRLRTFLPYAHLARHPAG